MPAPRVPNPMPVSPSSDPCGRGGIFKPEVASVRRYTTHHVYDQPAARL